jgi:hypothetical protein
MIRIGSLLITFCAFSIVARAQEDPLSWFPLHPGSRWVYEHEWKSGDRNRPQVDRWITEETITGWVTIPEGVVVLREVREQGSTTVPAITKQSIAPNGELRFVRGNIRAYLTTRDREPYLIHENCIYVIFAGWDAQRQELRPEYRKYLSEHALSADFCFPLQIGHEWGNPDVPWRVESARDGAGSFLRPEYAKAVHIFSGHFGSGGQEDVWFQKGVGVVGEHYIHNGTYDEYTKKLLSR